MSFFDNLKGFLGELWEETKPTFWEVFKFALNLVAQFAIQIIAGQIGKHEARDEAVTEVVKKFSNSPEFSETKAVIAVHMALLFYRKFGKLNSEDIITYDDAPDYMAWLISRPDKTKGE